MGYRNRNRNRNSNCLLKIAFVFVVCLLLYFLSRIAINRQNSYLQQFTSHATLKAFLAKVHTPRLHIRQNGEFWILENYIKASRQFDYLESVTYTTHGEYMFLDNVEEVTKRWRAPISIAIFAPNADFNRTIRSVDFLRSCTKEQKLIRELVTFHIYFPAAHMPSFIPKTEDELKHFSVNCTEEAPFLLDTHASYRRNQSIFYPINMGRNIARRMATTHFVFPCDIELYPNWNFVSDFLDMIHRKPHLLLFERQVYPLAIFEVERNQEIPNSKTDLQEMLILGKAIPFHKKVCMYCHAIPELNRWIQEKETTLLDIFLVAKHHNYWEPFYVTTNFEPYFDERYTWEGRYDKQIQADLLGMMNYDFCILNNAFLVHRPGIKGHADNKSPEVAKMAWRTSNQVKPQMKVLYGEHNT